MSKSDRHKNRRDQVRGRKPKHDPANEVDIPRELVNKAVDAFKKGQTVLYPTDTIFGLGCDATNYDAVQKIYNLKQRPESKSLVILVDSFQMLESVVENVPDMAWEVLKVNKKPLTIVYENPKNIAENVVASDDSLAVRVTNDPLCRAIIRKLRRPIVSTSANLSGESPPKSFENISNDIKEGVDYIVDLPLAQTNQKASTIMKISNNGVFKIIRE
ncbi:MAG: L-threonylcarbamoyladenylate synthase [Nonlabens sp.]